MTTHAHRPANVPRPVQAGTRPADVRALLTALDETLTTENPRPLLPLDPAGPPATDVLDRLVVQPPPGTAVVVQTSGSTSGAGHLVALGGAALRASARATHARLDGPGQWLACLPTQHIAGLQVLVRSREAGTDPVVVDTSAGFSATELAAAAAALRTDVPTYLSLVPTQLRRVLDAGAGAVGPLRAVTAILLGGARTPQDLLDRAREAGLSVVTTYGMTETGGGCVYDGLPLPGVRVRTETDGRVLLSGPVLASGYLDDVAADAEAFVELDGERWLRTADRGTLVPDAAAEGVRLRIDGRLDDVIISGGLNVSAAALERALSEVPGVGDVVVVGIPDEQWGALVTAVVTPGAAVASLAEIRAHVGTRLGRPHAPRALVVLDELPARGPGKVDRLAATAIAAAALARPAQPGGPAGRAGPGGTEGPAAPRVLDAERLD